MGRHVCIWVPIRACSCGWTHKLMETPCGPLLHTLQLLLLNSRSLFLTRRKQIPAESSQHWWYKITFLKLNSKGFFSIPPVVFSLYNNTGVSQPPSPVVFHLLPMPCPNTWCTSIITAHSELLCSLGAQAQHAELISFLVVVEPGYLGNLVQPWSSLTVKPHGKHLLISWKPCGVCWEKPGMLGQPNPNQQTGLTQPRWERSPDNGVLPS